MAPMPNCVAMRSSDVSARAPLAPDCASNTSAMETGRSVLTGYPPFRRSRNCSSARGCNARRALVLPRRCAQHVHELARRAEILQGAHGPDHIVDMGRREQSVRIGAQLALDLLSRQRVLGRSARMVAAR